jgi:hypothetical protein
VLDLVMWPLVGATVCVVVVPPAVLTEVFVEAG